MDLAQRDFQKHIRDNPYPGRGLVIGRSSVSDAWLQVYWIMGRSTHSQNRCFVAEGPTLRTEPVDPGAVEDPSLIIYCAMLELPSIYLVSNGDQTDTLYHALRQGQTFDQALAEREREPDAPNYTPRISGMLSFEDPLGPITLSILKANRADPAQTDRFTYRPAPPPPGLGYCLTTYEGDGRPLPSFSGDPLLLPCVGTAAEVLASYWSALDPTNRVALAVKEIPAHGGTGRILLCNRFGDAPPPAAR
ncbi:MAG: inosine monophosphate cyclohydrolase [Anaerolineae bacterium]|nr:inosine monophosphate cyclohydrolase [Anaerolineae bacterium]